MKDPQPPKPGIRIDGGKRRDLNGSRVAGRMAGIVKPPRSPEEVAASARAHRKADEMAQRNASRLIRDDGGKEGARLTKVKVKISSDRTAHRTVRCRTGTFEWRYGRKQTALFHAGNQFAILWERAGIAVASSADFLRGTASGYPTGVSDGRVAAIDALRGLVEKLGHFSFERLMMYCVHGMTASEIAKLERCSGREIGMVLNNDLRQCAIHFKFLGNATGRIRSTSEMT
ncbi:MAG: hypothetical protein ACTHNH_08525 [Mesorhizobium sp.]